VSKWRAPTGDSLSGTRHLSVAHLGATTAALRTTASASVLSAGEPTATVALAAGAGTLVASAATVGHAAATGRVVVASAVCVRLGSSLLDRDSLSIHGVGVGGNSRIVAGLSDELDKSAVLVRVSMYPVGSQSTPFF
jgi:hypothetical protein